MSENQPPQPPPVPFDYAIKCEIALTRQQQGIVKARTGRDMTEIVLEDPDGEVTRRMAGSSPDDFTLMAVRQAELLNDYEAEYHEYLLALAAWQASLNAPDPAAEAIEAAQIAAMQEAERLKLFYMKEAEECQNAREIAKIVWGKKDKTQ